MSLEYKITPELQTLMRKMACKNMILRKVATPQFDWMLNEFFGQKFDGSYTKSSLEFKKTTYTYNQKGLLNFLRTEYLKLKK